jgi:hypothetical protein
MIVRRIFVLVVDKDFPLWRISEEGVGNGAMDKKCSAASGPAQVDGLISAPIGVRFEQYRIIMAGLPRAADFSFSIHFIISLPSFDGAPLVGASIPLAIHTTNIQN